MAGRQDGALQHALEIVLARAPLQHVHYRQRLNRQAANPRFHPRVHSTKGLVSPLAAQSRM